MSTGEIENIVARYYFMIQNGVIQRMQYFIIRYLIQDAACRFI